jgi:hypothetical protein
MEDTHRAVNLVSLVVVEGLELGRRAFLFLQTTFVLIVSMDTL